MKRWGLYVFFLVIASCSGDLQPIDYNNPFDTVGTNPPVAVTVATVAGTGSSGNFDGIGALPSFYFPFGLAIDIDRTTYVADTYNHKIRKIIYSSSGIVTVSTYAGSGTPGSTDGTGTGASFNYPFSVALDSSGNLYVADKNNHKIRKIAPGGVVTTLAGGTPGDVNGTGPGASFNNPVGVAVDSSGNVYVADQNNNKIKKITPAGAVTTVADAGTTVYFNKPKGVAVDPSGNIYVSDESHQILKISAVGVVSVFAGSGSPGSGDGYRKSASFNYPWGLTLDSSGNIYVADQQNHAVRKITPDGYVITYAGFPGNPGSTDGKVDISEGVSVARFNLLTGVAYHEGSGNVHVADMNNHKIRVIFK